MEKPQSEIYKIACKRLGVKTDEVIYMDDSSVTIVINCVLTSKGESLLCGIGFKE